jgi:hypothetical protein
MAGHTLLAVGLGKSLPKSYASSMVAGGLPLTVEQLQVVE